MSTSLKASAIILPTSLSLLALIVATSTNFLPDSFFERLSSFWTICPDIRLISRITSVTFSFSDKYLSAASIIASANTILVVVPSPATVAVRSAACRIIITAKFSVGSYKLIDLATVTPSFVTVIPPIWFSDSINTVRPLAPNVLLTAPAIVLMPFLSFFWPSSPKCTCFTIILLYLYHKNSIF